jgi:hypothetical protein
MSKTKNCKKCFHTYSSGCENFCDFIEKPLKKKKPVLVESEKRYTVKRVFLFWYVVCFDGEPILGYTFGSSLAYWICDCLNGAFNLGKMYQFYQGKTK